MKKLKSSLNVLTKISLLCFAFFVLFPSLQAQAVFSDTDSINAGIKLELGTVSLDEKSVKPIPPLGYSGEDSVEIASSTLVNDGSLTGKLAYKIDVTDGDRVLTANELKNTMISIELGTEEKKVEATAAYLNTNSFAFIKNTSGRDIVIEPNSVGKVPITVSYNSSTPTKNKKITVKVTFRLIQSNAADANANLFSDEVTMENVVSLVPKVVEEENYWPDKSTFTNKTSNNKVTYSLEKMEMVFSEVYNPKIYPIKEIKNLNKAILYIQLPFEEELKTTDHNTGELIDTFKFYSSTPNATGKVNVESVELDEKKHGYKVTFSLFDYYDSSNPNKIQEYTNKLNYQLHQQFLIQKYIPNNNNNGGYYDTYAEIGINNDNYASRLVLSSDIPNETDAWNYEQKIIPLSAAEKTIIIKQLNKNSNWVYKSEFKDVRFTEETFEFEVKEKEKDSKLVDHSLISKNEFSLKLNPGGNSNEATLNVKITGDTKNTLVISRKLELQNYLMKMKSTKIPSTTKEVEQQTNSEEKIEESSSMIDSTLPNDQVIEEPIDGEDQEEVEEVIDSSSSDSDAELKEETVPIENSDQSTSEEKISDEQINE